MLQHPLVQKARAFAQDAHQDQTRKYTGEPYFTHCDEVARLVAEIPGATPEMVAAAYLHDTMEDCGTTLDTLVVEFGYKTAVLVYWLTDVSTKEHGNRRARKAIDRAHMSKSPHEAHTIKLADLISNSKSILSAAADGNREALSFAPVYMTEKKALLDILHGDTHLALVAAFVVDNYFRNSPPILGVDHAPLGS